MIALPQSVGIEDADVDEPPHQARPALTALPAWQVGVVKLIDDIDSAGVMEVVADGLRARQLIDLTCPVPALQSGEQAGINVVVEQQDKPLIAPGA